MLNRTIKIITAHSRAITCGLALLGVSVLFAVSTNTSVSAASTPTNDADHDGHCRNVSIPVTASSGAATIFGEFCQPNGRDASTVQLLVHGATYTHTYWDFPGFDGKYSYVHAANRAGYATLAIDRYGTGSSTRPTLPQDVTYQNEIATLHQVVQALRSGQASLPRFDRVELIAHSFGSAYSVGEVSTYQDVDAVVLTGFGHKTSASVNAQSKNDFYPANNLPQFKTLDAGYLTTKPGARSDEGLFYHLPLADPAVIAADDASKDTLATTELATRPSNLGTLTPAIHVPVLIADGQFDTHYCTPDVDNCTSSQTLYNDESVNFNTCLAVAVLQSGHDLNLHVTAKQTFRTLLWWSRQTIPPTGDTECAVNGPIQHLPESDD